MSSTTFTFRTEKRLKEEATILYENLGISLSSAINMFLKQSVLKKKFPCSVDLEIAKNYENTYPSNFFNLFGSGKNIDIKEPRELSFKNDKREQI